MQFKKIYIEITNACNFSCSYCYKSDRKKRQLSVDEFKIIVEKIKPFTNYIYLHVLGEPLLHSDFEEILSIAKRQGLQINITTNGAFVEKYEDAFLRNSVRQVNISLHDFEENIPIKVLPLKLKSLFDLSKRLSSTIYFNFRLWNRGEGFLSDFNKVCLHNISESFGVDEKELQALSTEEGVKLADHIFLQNAARFEWQTDSENKKKTCYALKDHIAILSDGSIVPCCIDADANLLLGNIFEDNLSQILSQERVSKIREGFARSEAVEDFCKHCGFRKT